MSMKGFFGNLLAGAKRKAPRLLTGFGIGLMFTGTVLAVRETPEAMRKIEEKKKEEGHEQLTLLQTVQATWQCYIWALSTELAGSALLIASLKEGEKREAVLMGVAEAGQNVLREFQDYRRFVQAQIGEKKEAAVYNQAAQKMAERTPPPADMDKEFFEGQAPKPACFHASYGRYFYVDYDQVREAVNELNNEIQTGLEGYVSLNDFYYKIHVGTTEYGDRVGWSIETGLITIPEKEDLRYVGTPNGWPCWVLEFLNPPQYEYKFFRNH